MTNTYENKKVLLRERKRHTACRVVSTPSVVLPGYPPRGGRGVSDQVPPQGSRYPPQGGTRSGTPLGGSGYPPGGYPVRYPPGGLGTPRGGPGTPQGGTQSGTPPGGLGTPPGGVGWGGVRVPPLGGTWSGTPRGGLGTPPLPHGILGNVAKHYGIWVPPPGVDRQTKWNYYLPVVLRTRAVTIPSLILRMWSVTNPLPQLRWGKDETYWWLVRVTLVVDWRFLPRKFWFGGGDLQRSFAILWMYMGWWFYLQVVGTPDHCMW